MGPIQFSYKFGQTLGVGAAGWLGSTVLQGLVTSILAVPALTQASYQFGHVLSIVVGVAAAYRYGGFGG
ncbi:hypothetical protein [Halohasta salina]|uniref:hypothetical protein n=1 Tax=Halohasta salina TaxID=2961621 RepID=UPI0020A47800|nr:hypothetical protein [Halohasta salina]